MFIRKKRNKSGSISIQLISKSEGRYKVVKTIGCATQQHDIEKYEQLAKQELKNLISKGQLTLFQSKTDTAVSSVLESLQNSSVRTIGPELIFGKIFNYIVLARKRIKMIFSEFSP